MFFVGLYCYFLIQGHSELPSLPFLQGIFLQVHSSLFFLISHQYQQDLENDEEIFAEKNKELSSAKLQIAALEEENAKLREEIEENQREYSQRSEQLFQQQLQIQTLERKQSSQNSFKKLGKPKPG